MSNRNVDIDKYIDRLMLDSTSYKPAWNIEALLEKKEAKWNYVDSCMMKALIDMYEATNEAKYLTFVKDFIDYYVDENGDILGYEIENYNCDNINGGKVLFSLNKYYANVSKYKIAIEKLMIQVRNQPRTSTDNFWHKKIYPNQIWLDGLYMLQPFYMENEMIFSNEKNYKDIFRQFDNVYNIMKDEKTGLLYHAYDDTKEMFWCDSKTGLSHNFWTRSLGWYTMALVDTIEKLDEQYFDEYIRLQKQLKQTLDALLVFQDKESNMFYQVTDKGGCSGNYLETSGSCAIAYSLLKGARLGYLPNYYSQRGKDIFEGVCKNKLHISGDEFSLNDICLVAGVGGMAGKGDYKKRDSTYEYYISEPKVKNDAKGVAPFIFSYAELLKI